MNKLIHNANYDLIRDFRYTDYKLVQELMPEFEKRRLNYDIDYKHRKNVGIRCFQ